jgi:hypothetical protein
MTSEEPTPGKVRGGKTGWIVALILLAGLFGAGALFLMSTPASRFSPAAMISVQEYFEFKSAKKVRAAWLDKSDLYAEVDPEYVQDAGRFRYVAVIVPPAYLVDPAAFRELQAGIDPSRFTVLRK